MKMSFFNIKRLFKIKWSVMNIKKPVLLLAAFIFMSAGLQAAPKALKDSVEYAGQWRIHYMYVPENLLPQKPLVVMLHGYGGKADGYRPEMLELAEQEGFALCIPRGLKAPEGKTGWYAGYPAQKGMREDDDEFICFLAAELCRKHSLNPENIFLTGMSNGGEMCYLIGRRHPEVFSAIASITGLTMKWVDDEVPMKAPVPFMQVHGTADKTSLWEGDINGEGGWGAYLPVRDGVARWVKMNECRYVIQRYLPPKKEGARTVVQHRWYGGVPAWPGGPACEVRLYEIRGGKHSWGLADMDTCSEVWNFFRIYLK